MSLHVANDVSKGLFKRAISQSGSALAPDFITSRNKANHILQKALHKLGKIICFKKKVLKYIGWREQSYVQ